MSATANEQAGLSKTLVAMSRSACERLGIPPVGEARIEGALHQAVDVGMLINNLAEVWRTSDSREKPFCPYILIRHHKVF